MGWNGVGRASADQTAAEFADYAAGGDSITYGSGRHHSGYRGPLGLLLSSVASNFVFVGSSTENSRYLPRNERHHEGHPSFAINDVYTNLDGFDDYLFRKYSGASRNPDGGHWLTGIASGPNARPALDPNVILLMVGTNDRNHPGGAGARLDRLVAKIITMRSRAHLIVARITPIARTLACSNFVASYNQSVNAVVAKYKARHLVTEVDLNTDFPADGFSDDHMHPNDIGYHWMAARWYNAILTALRTRVQTPPIFPRSSGNAGISRGLRWAHSFFPPNRFAISQFG